MRKITKPVIGITTFCGETNNKHYNKVSCSYIKVISKAGGVPVLVPQLESVEKIESYLQLIDGLVLSGGKDISPVYYREKPGQKVTKLNPIRDKWEIKLFKKVYNYNLPVLGICRGMQLMNVALGGSLYQDLKEQSILHCPDGEEYLNHQIRIEPKTKLYQTLCSDEITVNSYHHQAIKDLADDFKIVAKSQGKIIEAIEAVNKDFVIGVQWHPEDLVSSRPCFTQLFRKLVVKAQD